MSTPSLAHFSRSNASTNSVTNLAGWSQGTSSSRVGGKSQICSRFISRRGTAFPSRPASSRKSTPCRKSRLLIQTQFYSAPVAHHASATEIVPWAKPAWGDSVGRNPTDRGEAGSKRSILVDEKGGR